jgi:modulator of FtsH protease HflC
MKSLKTPAFLLIILLVFVNLGWYVVSEGHQALVLRWNKILLNPTTGTPQVVQPGLHYRIPLVESVKSFSTRLRAWQGTSSRMLTESKQEITVNYYVVWRINNVELYYTSVGGSEQRAQFLLEQQLNGDLRAQVGAHTVTELFTTQRASVLNSLRDQLNKNAETFGVSIIDVQFANIEIADIYEKMQAAQVQLASAKQADGKANAAAIRAAADANVALITTTAKEKAAFIRGAADAEAAKIYVDAYSKAPELYTFYRSLEAYKKIFANHQDVLVLKPDSQFFKYFNMDQDKTKH